MGGELPLLSVQTAAAFLTAVVAGFVVRPWDLRVSRLDTDIISRMVLDPVHPYGDYVKYVAILGAAAVAVAATSLLVQTGLPPV